MGLVLILFSFALITHLSPTYGYDPLDPNGNITIKWDVMQVNDDTQDVRLSIFNYQLFRHVEPPGWRLSWTWPGDEVIMSMLGAEATEQGDCSLFRASNQLPHCCDKKPVIIDLLPGAPFTKQVANCCKGGVLPSFTQGPDTFCAAFQMSIGTASASVSTTNFSVPGNFSLGLRGYSCGDPFEVPPSKFIEDKGRRRTQALATYNVTCSYSQFEASPAPTCCVSLSAFYNDTIVPCPQCSCGCQGQTGSNCVKSGDSPSILQLPNEAPQPVVQCTQHMCPIRVHWHVKESYREYWRVKITVTNFNYAKNYSQWNLVVLHPNMQNVTQVFSFNYKPLHLYGNINDTGMFYGIQYYNDILLQSGDNGNVQTEILFHKDSGIFTFREGWAFPRKISFNGDQCVMPPPDHYPRLPNSGHFGAPARSGLIFSSLFLLAVLF
ncbi:COBRA-like protein 6 precursor [Actinidia rufa]|uniref:COBRA-like protein n=1 Tax=Actinidia rufa TaxID=165716 RepID=A0A7J0ESB1_9ERIC|nr:COBRA-like protein 6 precursor [Actinidia rufa]